jgi:CIC family chloride channel protein
MEEVTTIFKDTGAWNLPVLKKGKYVGYISKSKLFSVYRRRLLEVSED